MSEYIMGCNRSQEGKRESLRRIVDGVPYVVTESGEMVEVLQDNRFPWSVKKIKTAVFASILDRAGYPEYAGRAAACSTSLEYLATGDGKRDLHRANFCNLRLCPLCSVRRAKKAASRLSGVMDRVQTEHEDVQYIFLTFTVRNVKGENLGLALTQLMDAWKKLMKHREIKRAIKGWFRAMEITYNRKEKEYHPHIHAIMAVESSYFGRKNALYLSQADWREHWRKALNVGYKPMVRVQATRDGKGDIGGRKVALEAAKYSVKDSEYIPVTGDLKEAAEITRDYIEALRGRRLTAFGGWLREAAKLLKVDLDSVGDLTHVDDWSIREDIAELIEIYHWHFGVADYLLYERKANSGKI